MCILADAPLHLGGDVPKGDTHLWVSCKPLVKGRTCCQGAVLAIVQSRVHQCTHPIGGVCKTYEMAAVSCQGSSCKGNPQLSQNFPQNPSVLCNVMWHLVIPCNHLYKSHTKLHHQLTIQYVSHIIYLDYTIPHSTPVPFHSVPTSFHIHFLYCLYFIFLPLSPIHDLLLIARLSVPYVVTLCLGSPQSFLFVSPLQGMHPSAVLFI